jgi:hypothetical protein
VFSLLILLHELIEFSLDGELRGAITLKLVLRSFNVLVSLVMEARDIVPYKCCEHDGIRGQPSPQLRNIVRMPSHSVPSALGLCPQTLVLVNKGL